MKIFWLSFGLMAIILSSACGGGSGSGGEDGPNNGSNQQEIDASENYIEPSFVVASEIVDINADGYGDILISAGNPGGIPQYDHDILLLNDGRDGSSFFYVKNAFPTRYDGYNGFTYDYAPGDFNSDGHIDVLTTQITEEYDHAVIRLYLGDGTGKFTQKEGPINDIRLPHWLRGISLGDFNKDGNLDFVTSTQECSSGRALGQCVGGLIYTGDGEGNFSLAEIELSYATATRSYSFKSYQLAWERAPEDPNRDYEISPLTENDFSLPAGVLVGDVDNDGDDDIVPTTAWSGAMLPSFVNTSVGGKVSFDIKVIPTESFKFHIGALVDLNGDGYLDVSGTLIDVLGNVTLGGQSRLEIGINDGEGGFLFDDGFIDIYAVGINTPLGFYSADFDMNGFADILIVNTGEDYGSYPGAPNVLLNNFGSQLVDESSAVLGEASTFTHQASIGDLNGDGYPDIYFNNSNQSQDFPGSVSSEIDERIFINDRTGGFSKHNPVVN
jgi:hypothetical protein